MRRAWGLFALASCAAPADCPVGSQPVTQVAPAGSSQRQTGCQTADGAWLGPSQLFFDNALTLRGHYDRGGRQGAWSFWSSDGELLQRIVYAHGKPVELDFRLPACPPGT